MSPKDYLNELATILEADPHFEGGVAYIRIEVNSARDIAYTLRSIADNQPNRLSH